MHTLTTCSFLNNIGDTPQSIDSPLQLKLISFLGLKNYMIDNFIFRRKPSKYHIRKKNSKNLLFLQSSQYAAPNGYHIQIKIIETSNQSIPICRLKPKHITNNNIIIYAHGNASDMADSLNFIQRLSQHIHTQFLIFDYTGYGQSRVRDVGQQIICRDLETVLAWITQGDLCLIKNSQNSEHREVKNKNIFRNNFKLQQIILWGFSLGTFPVIKTAAKYRVGAVVLQCPIASVSSLFHKELHPDMKFKEDHFANIDLICQIPQATRIFIMHSSADQIIPFSHGKLLYTKYINKNGEQNIEFIQIGKIKHNSLHKYIVSPVQNELQREVFRFLVEIIYKHSDSISSIKTEKSIKHYYQSKTINNTDQRHLDSYDERNKQTEYPQLKSLSMKVTEADITQINGDMQQLIIEQQSPTVKKKLIEGSFDKKCFCFPHPI